MPGILKRQKMMRVIFIAALLQIAGCAGTSVGASGGSSSGHVGVSTGIGF